MNLRQAIVFAILMENRDGIIGKAPSYIEEKLSSCENLNEPEVLLDTQNHGKFMKWIATWKVQFPKIGEEIET